MKPMPYQPSTYEHQLAMAILAHAARRDNHALTVSLHLLAESSDDLRPTYVIAALITEFQRGMETDGSATVARRFSDQAIALAAVEAAGQEG